MCDECVRDSIIKNAKKVLGLEMNHLDYKRINELSKIVKEQLISRNINVNDDREECIELFRDIFNVKH